jgi:hypothetical protein
LREKGEEEENEKQVKSDVFKKILKMMPFPGNYFVNPLAALAVKGMTNFKLLRRIMQSYILKKHKFKKQYEIILSDPSSKKEFEYACKLIKRYYDANIGKQFEILRTSKEIHRSCGEYRVLDKQFKLLNSARETNQHVNDTDILEIFGLYNQDKQKNVSDENEIILPKNKFELLYIELKKKYESPKSNSPASMNPINMNPTNMMNPIGMATSFQGGGIMNMANSLGGPAGQMMNLASEIDGNSNDANPVKNLKKAEEEENHSKIENLFILNKKNCSYLIPSIMIDIISGSEYIYGKNKDEKSEDENDIENIKYIGIDLDCDTAYTLKDVLLLSGLTKPVETAMGVEAGEVEKKIDDMVATTKKMMNGKNMMGGKKMGSYSKRLVPKKRRLTRRRVKVTK